MIAPTLELGVTHARSKGWRVSGLYGQFAIGPAVCTIAWDPHQLIGIPRRSIFYLHPEYSVMNYTGREHSTMSKLILIALPLFQILPTAP